jgi:hypothetical protein
MFFDNFHFGDTQMRILLRFLQFGGIGEMAYIQISFYCHVEQHYPIQ